MNPYAAQLAGRDPMPVIATSAGQLKSLLHTLGPERVQRPRAPGKWSPRQIACHLADCEIVFSYRLRQALAEVRHEVQPFDQDQFAKTYGAYDAAAALAVFSALRAWNLALLRSLPSEAFEKRLFHPERGEMVFRELVETMGGHDLNHLRQLEAVAAAA